jgi:hypothetical protein
MVEWPIIGLVVESYGSFWVLGYVSPRLWNKRVSERLHPLCGSAIVVTEASYPAAHIDTHIQQLQNEYMTQAVHLNPRSLPLYPSPPLPLPRHLHLSFYFPLTTLSTLLPPLPS